MPADRISFNVATAPGRELAYVAEAVATGNIAGDGQFTRKCHEFLQARSGAQRVLLTHSCTAALEMMALLIDIQPGDEIIMPSYTFVSTANAFVLRGGVPVFVDVRADTVNLDETLVEAAITPRTRAIMAVHYAGVSCDMDRLGDIAKRHGLRLLEDAAQGVGASYKGRALGGIGDLGAFSFHETKNVVSGEGGALLVNDPALVQRAEIIREKGTDRSRYFRGEVDKYTWQDVGSSFLPSEILAAFLLAQLEQVDEINARRMAIWQQYHAAFEAAEQAGRLRRPIIPADCQHNAHLYYVLLPDLASREAMMAKLRANNIASATHYVPLHSSPAGLKYTRVHASMVRTDDIADRLLRLPLHAALSQADIVRIMEIVAA